MTLWGGAFSQPTDDTVRALNDSLRFDWRLYDVDITGSIAWARALVGRGRPDRRRGRDAGRRIGTGARRIRIRAIHARAG